MAKFSEEELIKRDITKRFNKACKEYGLLGDGDHILVGLSGGKDSLTLLQLLAWQSRIHRPSIKVSAAHIAITNIPYKSDRDFLQKFCDGLGVPFIYAESSFDSSTDKRKSPCFLCSWNRRKALFEIAQERGCNKIALGHNMDDFLETLLMNLTFQGAFSAMTPKMEMNKFPITIIRPLCLVAESNVQEYACHQQFPPQKKNCPYERESNREEMKALLAHLETLNPEARYNMWGAMSNIQSELLPPAVKKQNKQ